jgi:predicted nuclease of predicted toxin-antitoxin system
MALLFDQNLSHKLVAMLSDVFEGAEHVRSAGLSEADDRTVRAYAMARGLTIVTFDSDFAELAALLGTPP